MQSLVSKNIWVIGASSGIGYELARQLAAVGNFVFLTARSESKMRHLEELFPARVSLLPGDITDKQDLAKIAEALYERIDVLDLVLLCAGTCEYDDGLQLDTDMYQRVFDVNFFAAVACTNIALPLLKRGRGNIVGVSSLASVVPFPRAEAYGASKVALEYFLQSLKVDLTDTDVRVTIVRPGFVDTPLTKKNDFDMPFLVDTNFAAKKIIRGLEKSKSVIDFPWQMSLTLKLFSSFKNIWMRLIAKQFRKTQEI